jgi:hypothetical protein
MWILRTLRAAEPRMYETRVYWETAHAVPDQPSFVLGWARHRQAAVLFALANAYDHRSRVGASNLIVTAATKGLE